MEQELPNPCRIDLSTWKFGAGLVSVAIELFTQRWATRKLGDATWACHESVRGKLAIVTGPTSGIGLEIAKELTRAGAHVVLACRNVRNGQRLAEEWKATWPSSSVEVEEVDLVSFESVRAFARRWEENGGRAIDILVNNAGIFSMGEGRKMTAEGHEQHAVVNYLSPFLLTLLLLPSLHRAKYARVVNVSSKMHELGSLDPNNLSFSLKRGRRKFSPTAAYCQSKLAQVMFTNWLLRTLPPDVNVDVVAVHPGEVLTDVTRTLPKWAQKAKQIVFANLLFSPSQGARGPLFCATHPSVGEHAAEVKRSDHRGGPYFTFECVSTPVAKHAKNDSVSAELWRASLAVVDLPTDYLEKLFV